MILTIEHYTPEQRLAIDRFFDPDFIYEKGGALYSGRGFFTYETSSDIRLGFSSRNGRAGHAAFFGSDIPGVRPRVYELEYHVNPPIDPKTNTAFEWLPVIYGGQVYRQLAEERTYPRSGGLAYLYRVVNAKGEGDWEVKYLP